MKTDPRDDDSLTVFLSDGPSAEPTVRRQYGDHGAAEPTVRRQFAVPLAKKVAAVPPLPVVSMQAPRSSVASVVSIQKLPLGVHSGRRPDKHADKFADGMSVVEFEEYVETDLEGAKSDPGTTYYIGDSNSMLGAIAETVAKCHLELAETYRQLDAVLRTGLGLAKEKRELLGSRDSVCIGFPDGGAQYRLFGRDEIYRKKTVSLNDIFSSIALLEREETVDQLIGQATAMVSAMCDEPGTPIQVLQEFATLLISGNISVVRRKTFLREVTTTYVLDGDEARVDATEAEKLRELFGRTDRNCTDARNLRAAANSIFQRLESAQQRLDRVSDGTSIAVYLTNEYRLSRYTVTPPERMGSDVAVSLLRSAFGETSKEFCGSEPLGKLVTRREFGQALRNRVSRLVSEALVESVGVRKKRWNVVELE